MNLNSNKAEAITLAVTAVVGVFFVVGLLFRPMMDKVLPIFGNNQKIVTTKTVESNPVWVQNPDGTKMLVQKTSTNESLSDTPVKLSFFQKIQSLGMLGMLLVILGIMFPPFGAILMIIWNRVSSAAKKALESAHDKIDEVTDNHNELNAQAKRIVQSIDNGLASMDANIKAANTMADSTTDANVKASYITIAKALVDMKQDFLDAMSKKQDSETKLLVSTLKND